MATILGKTQGSDIVMNLSPAMTKESMLNNHWLVPLLLVLVSYPTWLVLTTSPILLVVPAALTAFWILNRQGHWFLAGLLTALCVFRIEYLPFLVLPGLILGRFYFLGGISIAAIAVYVTAQAMHLPLDMPTLIAVNSSVTAPNLMQNFAGLLVLFLGEGTAQLQTATLAIYAFAIISVTEIWWRLHHMPISQNKFLKKCCVTILVILLTSPHTYIQDYIALIPVAIWLWQATADNTKDNLKLIRQVIVCFPILSWLFFIAQSIFITLHLPVYFIWAVALVVVVLPTLDDETNQLLTQKLKS
jgi:hypothetical protein